MTQINLLPWRERERKESKINFAIILGGFIVLAILFIIILHFYFSALVSNQQKRNTYLQSVLDQESSALFVLNKKKKQTLSVDTELHFVISLREESYRAVRMLDALSRVIPEAVTFNKIIREGNKVTIIGKSKSNLQVTLMMENIAKSPIFKQPNLTEISSKESNSGEEREFQIKVELQD